MVLCDLRHTEILKLPIETRQRLLRESAIHAEKTGYLARLREKKKSQWMQPGETR